MGIAQSTYRELAALMGDLRRDYPGWRQNDIVSQIRRSMPEYTRGVWSLAMPFNRGDSDLPDGYRDRFQQLRLKAIADDQLDLAHVFTSIDVKQSIDIIRDAYASWAGDLGTHVLANFARQAQVRVGDAGSLASLEDLQGDIDGDNIARHMPEDRALDALLAYYRGDETLMNGVTVDSRYQTFARDMGLLDAEENFSANRERVLRVLRDRTREFIEFDDLDLRNPLTLLEDLFDASEEARIDDLLETALDQFLEIVAAGLRHERDQE